MSSTNDFPRGVHLDTIIAALKEIEDDLSLPLLLTILMIAKYPEGSVNDLAGKLGVPQQTASRYVAVLQGRYETLGKSSFARAPLIELQISADDPRKRAVSLTERGKKKVAEILGRFYPRSER